MSAKHCVLFFGLPLNLWIYFKDPELSLRAFQSLIDSIAYFDIIKNLDEAIKFKLSKLVNIIRLMLCIIV